MNTQMRAFFPIKGSLRCFRHTSVCQRLQKWDHLSPAKHQNSVIIWWASKTTLQHSGNIIGACVVVAGNASWVPDTHGLIGSLVAGNASWGYTRVNAPIYKGVPWLK